MLVLLPPSEGKATGGEGPRLHLPSMSWHKQLGPTRRQLVKELVDLCRGDRAAARAVLGLSEALDADRRANTAIRTSPTMPAGERYAGVLYDALGYATLPAAARRRADASLVTFSGLWGAIRPTDAIPAYRIGINTGLPGRPGIPAIWRQALGAALGPLVEAEGALDFRSTGYDAMARLPAAAAARVVPVQVKGPSFQSKQAKGRLVRAMLLAGGPSVDGLLAAAARLGLPPPTVEVGRIVVIAAG